MAVLSRTGLLLEEKTWKAKDAAFQLRLKDTPVPVKDVSAGERFRGKAIARRAKRLEPRTLPAIEPAPAADAASIASSTQDDHDSLSTWSAPRKPLGPMTVAHVHEVEQTVKSNPNPLEDVGIWHCHLCRKTNDPDAAKCVVCGRPKGYSSLMIPLPVGPTGKAQDDAQARIGRPMHVYEGARAFRPGQLLAARCFATQHNWFPPAADQARVRL